MQYREYALQLLQLASTTGCQNVRLLLFKGPLIHEERRFNYDLLAAAVFKGHISLVNTLASIHLKINAGTFGDPFEIAMLARNYDILAILFCHRCAKEHLR